MNDIMRDESNSATAIDEKRRHIYCLGEVNLNMMSAALPAINVLGKTNRPLTITLVTEGGDADIAWALYDAIKMCRGTVTINTYGYCQSAGALLLQAGDVRLVSPSCRIMIHSGSAAVQGTVEVFSAVSKEVSLHVQSMLKVFQQSTGLPMSQIKKWCRTDTYFSAQQAVKIGLADAILPYRERGKG